MTTDEQIKIEVEKRLKAFLDSNPKDNILDDENVSDDIKQAYIEAMENAEKKMRKYRPVGKSPIIEMLEQIVRGEFFNK